VLFSSGWRSSDGTAGARWHDGRARLPVLFNGIIGWHPRPIHFGISRIYYSVRRGTSEDNTDLIHTSVLAIRPPSTRLLEDLRSSALSK